MKDFLTFWDLLCFISFIPFIVPKEYLSLTRQRYLCLIVIIIFLIYKIIYLYIISHRKFITLTQNLKTANQNRDELAKQFRQKNNEIDKLQYINNQYNQLMSMLIQTLNIIMFTKGVDKDYVTSLLKLTLIYKSVMEDVKNGKQNL